MMKETTNSLSVPEKRHNTKHGCNLHLIDELPCDPRLKPILPQFCAFLSQQLGDALQKIYLYGSQARGDWTNEDSDTDIAIVLDRSKLSLETESVFNKITDIVAQFWIETQDDFPVIMPIWFSKDLDASAYDSSVLIQNIRREGVIIYE